MALVYSNLKQNLLCSAFMIRIKRIIIESYAHLEKGLKVLELILTRKKFLLFIYENVQYLSAFAAIN